MVRVSKLDEDDARFKPLYKSKEYEEKARQIKKHQARANWFKTKSNASSWTEDEGWKKDLPPSWKGSNLSQRVVPGMQYTSIIKIPNTNGARLFKSLIAAETRLAKLSGYNVKIVESSGVQLV